MPLVETAQAKVNLALHVVGRRDDGYHLLDMLVAFPDTGDALAFAPDPRSDFSLTMTAASAPALVDCPAEDNLVLRAARAFRDAFGRPAGGRFTLEKRLPVAGGVGGGSADAAATLRLLARLEGIEPADPVLAALALGLGADVPMCLASASARVRGIGEDLTPVPGLPPLGVVLANPGVAVATPAVFRSLAHRDNPPLPPIPPFVSGAELVAWLASTRNDLQAPAIRLEPRIGTAIEALARLDGARFARMSGSGATCFALFDDRAAAESAAASLRRAHPDWWTAAAAIA